MHKSHKAFISFFFFSGIQFLIRFLYFIIWFIDGEIVYRIYICVLLFCAPKHSSFDCGINSISVLICENMFELNIFLLSYSVYHITYLYPFVMVYGNGERELFCSGYENSQSILVFASQYHH